MEGDRRADKALHVADPLLLRHFQDATTSSDGMRKDGATLTPE